MNILNTKTQEITSISELDFKKQFSSEIFSAEERWMKESEEGRKYASLIASDDTGKYDDLESPFFANLKANFNEYGDKWTSPTGVSPIYKILDEKLNKQIYFKKNGLSAWREYGPVRNINDFNRDFADWVARYYEGCEQQACQSWEDAEEVLNSVGASAEAGQFKLEDR